MTTAPAPTADKRTRTRLAKAELWMQLAMTAQRWADEVGDRSPHTRPFAEWEDDGTTEPFHDLCRRYSLGQADLSRLLAHLANEVENRAVRAGYEDAWVE